MPERPTLDTLGPTMIAALTEWQLKGITKGTKTERQGLLTFTDLAYAALLCLQNHPSLGANPFLTMDHRFALARRMTLYVYDRSLILVHYDFYDEWKREWSAIKRRLRQRMKQAEVDDGSVGGAKGRQARDLKKAEIRQLHAVIIERTQAWFAPRIAQLLAVTASNPSPWEQAFFAALLGSEQSRWFQLLDPARCIYGYRLGAIFVPWAFFGRDGKNAAIGIFSSRSASEAEWAAAEQWCGEHGWGFFGFTHGDIAANLDACVAKVESGVAWHLSPY